MNRINQGLPENVRSHYDELIVRRRDESLTAEELDELLPTRAEVKRASKAADSSALAGISSLTRYRAHRLDGRAGHPGP